MFDFKKLVSPDYLFTINRVMLTRSDKLFLVLGMGLVVVAIAFKIAALYAPSPIDKTLRNKFFNLFLTVGLLEVVWFGARYENVRFFGTHFVALLILLIGLLWLIKLLVSVYKNYRNDKQLWEKEQVKLRYLIK